MPSKPSHRLAGSSGFFRRIVLPVGLLILAPVLTYTALELANLNERERLIEDLYQAQLSAILFSVNQYCWDVVNGWGNFFRTELSEDNRTATSEQIQASLAVVQQRYKPVSGAFLEEGGELQLVLVDTLAPLAGSLKQSILRTLKLQRDELARMIEHAEKGYVRPAVLSLEGDTTRSELLFVFSLEERSSQRGSSLGGLLVYVEPFVQQILSPKIAEFRSKDFLLAVRKASANRFLLSPDSTLTADFEQEERLWILPDMTLAIKLAGQNAAQIAAGRTQRTVLLMLVIDVIIIAAVILLLRLMWREAELARMKSDFVDNVSHDLRTPLGLIRMFAETLEMNRVPDEASRREYYGVITRESERLTRLIDNVLDFSRIEGGRQRYDIIPGGVEPIVHEVVEAFRYPLAQQGFKVDVEIAPDLPDVPLDAPAMKQALANLVDNAIKYSGERRRLRVSARHTGDEVLVEVADEGLGIPPAETQRIFEKFYRIGRSETQGRRGSGVGLALVKHIVEAHGGRVSVESRVGEGSRFTLHLPVREACPES